MPSSATRQIEFDVTGMTCAACSARVEKVLSRQPGVASANVNLALERATIDATEDATEDGLAAAIERAGYGAQLRVSDSAKQRQADEELALRRRAEERQTLLRTLVSALLSIPLVIGTAPMMLGLGDALIGPWTQAFLAAGVMAVSGTRFYREAFAALRGGGANMAVLVSIGTSVAFLWSLWQVVAGHGHGHLYFEAAAVVLTSGGHAGKVYELAGDTGYTLAELAAEISRQTGRAIPYVDLPEAEYAAALKGAGLPEGLAEGLASWDVGASQGGLFDDGHQLSKLLGRPTTPLSTLVAQALQATG